MIVEVKILNKEFYNEFELPGYSTDESAGIDLYSPENYSIAPGSTGLICTGLSIWIKDPHYVGLIVPRSGWGLMGLVLANTIGVIDSDYQGELKIAVWNRNPDVSSSAYHTQGPLKSIPIQRGDRIAQLLFMPVEKASFCLTETFSNKTERNNGGFGSTGY